MIHTVKQKDVEIADIAGEQDADNLPAAVLKRFIPDRPAAQN